MARRRRDLVRLELDQIVVGYHYSVSNAIGLVEAAFACLKVHAPAALAVAQIAQEEIGKSYLLAASTAFSSDEQWRTFWATWKDHEAKSRLAFWYEWISPKRFAFTSEGEVKDGLPSRPRFSLEKEAGLYVDYSAAAGAFTIPADEVDETETMNRVSAVLSLGQTATVVHDAITTDEYRSRLPLFGAHMAQLFVGFASQEEMHRQLEEMAMHDDLKGVVAREIRDRLKTHWEETALRAQQRKDSP